MISVETSEIVKMATLDHIGPVEEVITLKLREAVRMLAGLDKSSSTGESRMIGTGSIEINSVPSGAKIFIDGQETQEFTPKVMNLSAGQHTLRLETEDKYGTKQIFIVPDVTSKVDILLKTGYGSLNIISQPLGAEIFLNGKPYGKTPANFDTLLAGEYLLELRKDRFVAYEEKIDLNLNEVIKKDIKLIPSWSSLRVISQPPGAEVFLNGNYLGKTPVLFDTLIASDYKLKLQKKGYVPYM